MTSFVLTNLCFVNLTFMNSSVLTNLRFVTRVFNVVDRYSYRYDWLFIQSTHAGTLRFCLTGVQNMTLTP